jgi:hypothetical protein
MRLVRVFLALCLAVLPLAGTGTAAAAPALGGCTGFIDALPATISTPGTWCLRANLATGAAPGYYTAVTIASNDVVLDCNGFGISGPGLQDLNGVYGYGTSRVTVRRCVVSNFRLGITIEDYDGQAQGIVFEDNTVTDVGYAALWSSSVRNAVMRRNRVARVGGLTTSTDYYGIVINDGIVEDNTIEDMAWPQWRDGQVHRVAGIRAGGPGHVTIRGNRIRKLNAEYGWGAIGIWLFGIGDATITGNDIAGDMVNAGGPFYSTGIFCFADSPIHVPTVDNVFTGFPVPVQGCQGARDNDESL